MRVTISRRDKLVSICLSLPSCRDLKLTPKATARHDFYEKPMNNVKTSFVLLYAHAFISKTPQFCYRSNHDMAVGFVVTKNVRT